MRKFYCNWSQKGALDVYLRRGSFFQTSWWESNKGSGIRPVPQEGYWWFPLSHSYSPESRREKGHVSTLSGRRRFEPEFPCRSRPSAPQATSSWHPGMRTGQQGDTGSAQGNWFQTQRLHSTQQGWHQGAWPPGLSTPGWGGGPAQAKARGSWRWPPQKGTALLSHLSVFSSIVFIVEYFRGDTTVFCWNFIFELQAEKGHYYEDKI